MNIRLIGDVHGQYGKYLQIVKEANEKGLSTIQLGDLGFQYEELEKEFTNSKCKGITNRCILGNHDWYPRRPVFDLGDYGLLYDNTVFFVRGSFSIDWKYQLARGTWFSEEELSLEQCYKCEALYTKHKDTITTIISHDCPRQVANKISSPTVLQNFGYNPNTFTTRTSELLQRLLDIHSPKDWYHGHFHKDYSFYHNGCNFTGLGICSYIDI